MHRIPVQRFSYLAVCVFFATAICLPLLDQAIGLDPSAALSENRRLTTLPSLHTSAMAVLSKPGEVTAWTGFLEDVAEFPSNFTRYFNDHFGFRRLLVRTHSRLVLLGWPARGDVLLGQQGWLFLGDANVLETYQAGKPFSEQQLADWQRELERRRDWLATHGSDYLVIIAPEKSTIYPELMPASVPRLGQETRLDQLMQYLEANSSLQVVDPRDALIKAKAVRPTYYATDTHWNAWGAFVAYQQIQAQLASPDSTGLQPVSESDYAFELQDTTGGDLAGMLALKDELTDDYIAATAITPRNVWPAAPGIGPLPNVPEWNQPEAWESPELDAPTLVMFRDSFGAALIPFLAPQFRRSLFLHRYGLDEATILREHPTLVIEELAERTLHQYASPPLWDGAS